ncbi:MFS transporter [Altericroceibacterium spongiae]|uniref:MFS transporter n=1 Tax=Altericroceibacterium spongiae TaxID=2320269 RepID=A0A420ERR1_9SPHN|nr:MFS transporter [Altericroceibacterium spongiae]RKF23313.1 MFS transporter [Altericroceibacterium spongiae]
MPASSHALPETPRKGAVLTVVALATALVLVVFTIPLTTLGSSSAALSAGPAYQAWILSAMPLGCAIGLLPGGAMADDHGRRLVFNAGLTVMGLTLIAGLIITSPLALTILRILHGVGGAAVMACGLGLIAKAFPEISERTHATAIWAAALGAGVAVGPIFASLIDHFIGWRAVYGLEGAVSIALALTGAVLLPESKADKPRPVDLAGSLLLGCGMATLLAGMTEARQNLFAPLAIALALAGAALLTGFVLVEQRKSQPMLDMALFRRPDFSGATLGAFFSGAGVLAIMSIVPTVLERGYGISPVMGAIFLLAWSATSAVTALGARYLPAWATPHRVIIIGLVACAIGQTAIGFLGPDSHALRIVPGMILAGSANGFLNAALGRQAIASVPAERAAMGSGANNTARYLGSSVGLTLGAILIAHGGETREGLFMGWDAAVILSAVMSLLGALCIIASGLMKAPALVVEN